MFYKLTEGFETLMVRYFSVQIENYELNFLQYNFKEGESLF